MCVETKKRSLTSNKFLCSKENCVHEKEQSNVKFKFEP